jgi:LmbE family N-acetylglucosaminyl deacetylase
MDTRAEHPVPMLGSIVGIWAHPDDEAFLSAGLMYLARRAGHRVVVVTATAGEHGTSRPDEWPPEVLAPTRIREELRALAALGVDELVRLGYRDGSCAGARSVLAASQIAHVLDGVRPDIVVTFGPEGMTGHPDHRAVSRWTTQAVEMTGLRPRLLHATVTPEFVVRHRRTNATLGAFGPGTPVTTEADELALRLTLDEQALDAKMAALQAHATQTKDQERLVGPEAFRAWFSVETFADGWAADDRALSAVG